MQFDAALEQLTLARQACTDLLDASNALQTEIGHRGEFDTINACHTALNDAFRNFETTLREANDAVTSAHLAREGLDTVVIGENDVGRVEELIGTGNAAEGMGGDANVERGEPPHKLSTRKRR